MAQTQKKTYEEQLLEAESALSGLEYRKSDAVLSAEQALADYAAARPAGYQSSYQEKLDGILAELERRGTPEYSFDADPLYQQYKDQYTRSARLALQDTVAAATAATGGYGSSYAASAGSQAYQQQIAELDAALPMLYGLALDKWNAENDALHTRLSDLAGLERDAQATWQDSLDAYYEQLEWLTNAASDAYDKDYKAFENRRKALTDQRDYYAGQVQQAVKNAESQAEYELAVKKYEESVRQWEAEQAAKQAQWQAELAAAAARAAASSGSTASSSSSGGSTVSSGGSTASSGGSVSASSGGSSSSGSTTASSGGSASSGTTTLSDAARQVQRELTSHATALTSRIGGGVTTGERNRLLRQRLRDHVSAGTITKAEANLIGKAWGIAV